MVVFEWGASSWSSDLLETGGAEHDESDEQQLQAAAPQSNESFVDSAIRH